MIDYTKQDTKNRINCNLAKSKQSRTSFETWRFEIDGKKFLGIQNSKSGMRLKHGCGYEGRNRHTGYYADSYQDDLYIPAYVLFPARNGFNHGLLGYYDDNGDCYIFNLADSFKEKSSNDSFDPMDLLKQADSIAEHVAEKSRDEDLKFQAEQEIESLHGENDDLRQEIIAILSERKPLKNQEGFPALCKALKDQVSNLLQKREKNRQRIESLKDNPFQVGY